MRKLISFLSFSSIAILFITCGLLFRCNTLNTLTRSFQTSPRDVYVNALTKNNLTSTSMAKAWLVAGDPNHHDSVFVNLPFRETGFFSAAEPQGRFYRFDVKDGQVLTLTCGVKTKEKSKLFIDLFSQQEGQWKLLEYSDSLTLHHEMEKAGSYLVRLQPELLVTMYYSITLSVTPVLLNPVKGASNKSIGSFYGDPRDGGKRKHEGIDIFAAKGTFVIAPTDGVVTKVSMSTLGGKTVWMNDIKRGHSYYFAHLDSQIAKVGMRVKQGDILGTVGNTGNAINTPSHLHFGVFQNNYKDPVAYIKTMEKLVNELAPDTLFQSIAFRINQKNGTLYSAPSIKGFAIQSLPKDYYIKVIAQTPDWYRVLTADNREGFVEKAHSIPAEKGNKFTIKKETALLSEAQRTAVPISKLSGDVIGLASFKSFRFVKTPTGLLGWIDLSAL